MADDTFGREHLSNAWIDVFGQAPELHQIQLVQAVARLESGYGRGTYHNLQTGESAVLNNWGASQAGRPPCNPATSFEATDEHGPEWQAAHPGEDPHYQSCYSRFDTPQEGAAHHLKVLSRIVDRSALGFFGALSTRSVNSFVRSMREGGYFEAGLEFYQNGIWKNVNAIANNLGEPLMVVKEEQDPQGDDGDGGSATGPLSQACSASHSSGGGQASSERIGSSKNAPGSDELYEPEKFGPKRKPT